MKKILNLATMMLCAVTLMACAQPEQPSSPKEEPRSELKVERAEVKTGVAIVEAVDLKTRMVNLRSLEGRHFTIHVGKEAVNLPQLRKGDRVEVTYGQALEVRMAEPGEVRNETETVIGRAKPGSKPGMIGGSETTITATILDIDKVKEMATLKMADGVVTTVKVQNPANLDKVKVGDTIVISYLEVLEISVKGKKK